MGSMKTILTSIIVASILLIACEASPQETTSSEWWVTNPTSGAQLYVKKYTPDNVTDEALSTLVLVPGGNGDSSKFGKGRYSAQTLANEGFIVITFDPDGRGDSEGTEDYNGFTQQDGLKAVIESADSDSIGLVTFSYGITMGSGVLARYPELPVKFLIDWEGPADRNDTGGCDSANTGHLKEVADCNDEAFWAEREALTFISQIEVPYLRLQSEKDHAQPDVSHAIAMVNAAVRGGKTTWVRLNDEVVNTLYSSETLPELMPDSEEKDLMEKIGAYAQELF